MTAPVDAVGAARPDRHRGGTRTAVKIHKPMSATASHFHRPSGSSRMRPALPLMDAYLRVFFRSWRCMSGSSFNVDTEQKMMVVNGRVNSKT